MTVLVDPEWSSEVPDLADDDPARSWLISVTILRKTCVHTWKSVLRCLEGHYFSSPWYSLWDYVIRTQISENVFNLLQSTEQRSDIMKGILASNL